LKQVRREDGQGVVEFAMILPILGALVLIFIQFGKAINYWIDLTHVANEGARFATVGAPGAANFKASVCNLLETGELRNGTGEIDAAKVTVAFPTGRDVGNPVKVTVVVRYHWLPFWNVTNWDITGSATMRLEKDSTGNAALNPGTGTCPSGT
jgi:Flp pilus assembly protein TadG